MIKLPFAAGKTYAVLGLGKTGLSAAQALKDSGATVFVWDDKQESRAAAAASGHTLVDLGAAAIDGITALVISPGIPTTFPTPNAIAKRFLDTGIPVYCDIELLVQAQPNAKYIGITGTNGKSTTTSLIHHILSEEKIKNSVGGNLGQAVLTLAPMDNDGVFVLELSSYQLELTPSLRFDIAVLLNITPDHLDRHGGMEGYVRAKENILRDSAREQRFVIGVDDNYSAELAAKYSLNTAPISVVKKLGYGTSVIDGVLYENGNKIAQVDNIPSLPGVHNAQNIAAAFSALRAFGMEAETIIAHIRTFPGLAHRQEIVGVIDDVAFVNDSKATNVDAAAKALACYNPIYWIAGGKPKDGGFEGLTEFLPNVRHTYLIGEAAAEMAAWLDKHNSPYTITETLPRAVQAAAHEAWKEDIEHATVLLSPACASFDQFPNFEARGELFRTSVLALKVEAAG